MHFPFILMVFHVPGKIPDSFPWDGTHGIPGQVGEIQQHPDLSCFNSECRGQWIHAAKLSAVGAGSSLAALQPLVVGSGSNFGDVSPLKLLWCHFYIYI